MATMTKKGARSVTATLDRVAELFQKEWATMGVPEKIATDFALRCDMLSDHMERAAGIDKAALTELDVMKEPGFNPEEIGQEKKGPLEGEPDEPFMKGEFTQQENRELRERVQDGDLGADTNVEPQAPSSGKQAFEQIGRDAISGKLASANSTIQSYAMRLGATNPKLASELLDLAGAVMGVQKNVLTGRTSAAHAARTLEAIDLLSLGKPTEKLPQMVMLATKVAKKADEDEEVVEEKKDDEKTESKKAGEVPEAFKKQWDKNDKGDDKGDEKKDESKEDKKPDFLKKDDEKDDEKKDEKTESKKASHGFNLFA